MPDILDELTDFMQRGLPASENTARGFLERLFGERYHSRHFSRQGARDAGIRDAYALAGEDGGADGVPYAGLIHGDEPGSGPYGGTSLVWFPSHGHGSLLSLVVGTRGLSPDEGILTHPGHRRRVGALRRYLSTRGIAAWSKPDPAALDIQVPANVTRESHFAGFAAAFKRYGKELYCIAHVPAPESPKHRNRARLAVQAFFDLYAYERRWNVLARWRDEFESFDREFRRELFPLVTADAVHDLLLSRRFVVLQGPPGTGKSRLAKEVLLEKFGGRGLQIQFHPAVTYEDFVVGLSPDPVSGELRFQVREGWLLQAAREAADEPYLLSIDEVNRADLGKVLGEAIYLFEAGEVGGPQPRQVRLPHAVNGQSMFSLPENLYVLATMNTADRSIASVDLAIRRRFAFVTMHPDRAVVDQQDISLATDVYDRLVDVFVEHAPHEVMDLLPGHAYFLANDEDELRQRLRFELLPLLDEYLREGYLGPATTELQAVRDLVADRVS